MLPVVTGIGFVVLLVASVLAKVANHFNVGPCWLRRFKLDKNTYY
jgi:hypothetical protein